MRAFQYSPSLLIYPKVKSWPLWQTFRSEFIYNSVQHDLYFLASKRFFNAQREFDTRTFLAPTIFKKFETNNSNSPFFGAFRSILISESNKSIATTLLRLKNILKSCCTELWVNMQWYVYRRGENFKWG